MHEDRWLGWVGLVVAFAIFQAVRAALRGAKGPNSGMARLNAAAERILKQRGVRERGASAANPIPRSNGLGAKATGTRLSRVPAGAAKAKPPALLPKSSTPAVIRRHGI